MIPAYCALGKAAPNEINFSVASAQLPGYRILMASPQEWMQLATFLLDYACSMNSPARPPKTNLVVMCSPDPAGGRSGACRGGRQWHAATNQRIALSAERASTLRWAKEIPGVGEHLFAAGHYCKRCLPNRILTKSKLVRTERST